MNGRLAQCAPVQSAANFSTDANYYVPRKTRGEVAIGFISTWKAAGIPVLDIIRAMSINGCRCSETYEWRGPIKVGLIEGATRRSVRRS